MNFHGTATRLSSYPIKGLSARTLPWVELLTNTGFPSDRLYGFARKGSGFDRAYPKPLSKDKFLMLMKDERLAGLATELDPDTAVLVIRVAGHEVLRSNIETPDGRRQAELFFARMFDLSIDDMPELVRADPHRFTDVSVVSSELMNAVSLINLDSVADFEGRTGEKIDPARFRANILFHGWPAFSELELVGRTIRIGTATARITLTTRRCAATEVNPASARRDLPVPRMLFECYGHSDMGVYAEIVTPGRLAPGDAITLEGEG